MSRSALPCWIAAALVVGVFFACAEAGGSEWAWSDPGELYYNALVRGFRSGHLSLAKEVPPGLAALPHPYDPAANAPYRAAPYFLQDASYFHGKLYLYFGVAPALLLFWPWLLLTGHYLAHKSAVALFCSLGFLASAAIARALRNRYFPEAAGWILGAGVLALGLGASMPLMLQRPGICEVPISCAYACLMLALAALWRALHRPERRGRWLAAASLAYGLAIAARPSDLFAAAALALPLALLPRGQGGGRGRLRLAAAALLPAGVCGLGLLLYNQLRFGSPADFGHAYQLSDIGRAPGFGLRFLASNLRLYFLSPSYWTAHFPFNQGIVLPPPAAGAYPPDGTFGILPNIPLVALALAVPFALRGRAEEGRRLLRAFLLAVALMAAAVLAPLLLYFAACGRYEAEFLPFLVLLAVAGIFALERALAGRGRLAAAARAGWLALVVFSIGFNLLASCGRYAGERYTEGRLLEQSGRNREAAGRFAAALWANPRFLAPRLALAELLLRAGAPGRAAELCREAVVIDPAAAPVHYLLANALDAAGRLPEAVDEYELSLHLDPKQPRACNNLGIALARSRRLRDAAVQFQAAVTLDPRYGEARANLGNVLLLMGRLPEAVQQYEQALQLDPGNAALRARLELARRALSRP
ncbi:MAG TPA: tetratricopeptide repeat protein [Opitutaceae bacterium]|nr:tetratricopeptide repeat protein [Opitutaceae bacterium]